MPNPRRRILIVDDNPDNIRIAANILKILDYTLGFARSGDEALQRLADNAFDLILMDVMMPGMDGIELCRRVKQDPALRHIPVIFITARSDEDTIEQAYEVGGVDYVTKPFKARELQARVKSQLRQLALIEELEFLATRDPLTGIYNRRKFFNLGVRLFESAKTVSGMMIDVDHFKRFNDDYGHDTGDEVLRAITRTVQASLPEGAVFGRLGGEEFAVILPTDFERAYAVAETIRQRIAEQVVTEIDARPLHCTVSIGLGSKDAQTTNIDMLLKSADNALYRAKKGGRNRTVSRQSSS